MNNLLIIDDDLSSSFAEELKYLGYTIEIEHNAGQVIQKLHSKIYNALILDINMPIPESWSKELLEASDSGMKTGIVLFGLIRKSFPTLPVLIYSVSSHDIKNDQYTYSIRKPELTSVIIQKLKELLAGEME